MEEKEHPQCAKCSVKDKICQVEGGKGTKFCPTTNYGKIVESAVREYERPEVKEFARMASIQEGECYSNRNIQPFVSHPVKPRVQEICEFAKKMGYQKLGVASCGGLHSEAGTTTRILEAQGFEVVSVTCKVGRTPKETIGIREEEKIRIGIKFVPI